MKARPLHERVTKMHLERLYIKDCLSTLQLAERLGTNRETVRRLIHRYGIEMRSKGTGMVAKHRP